MSTIRAGNGTDVARAKPRPLDAPVIITSPFTRGRVDTGSVRELIPPIVEVYCILITAPT